MGSRPSRSRFFAAAAACAAVVAVLGLMVQLRWDPLLDVDTGFGTPAETWSFGHPGAVRVLLVVEFAFGTVLTTIYVGALTALMWVKGCQRAVVWTIAVTVGTSATTTTLKLLLRRPRPEWDDPVHALNSFSFPSSHASGIASGMGVVAVLAILCIHTRAIRAAVLASAAALVVLVGADRILLGVHNVSDVLAGYAVAGTWLFLMLGLYPPWQRGDHAGRARDMGGQEPEPSDT